MATPWYRVVTPRAEVREGRSFNPDEFAIALEQVTAGTAPEDYRLPDRFFARTSFTRALTENVGLVMRRLSGETANTAPVLTLLTQFGGGKTHTLTALYHLAKGGDGARAWPGVTHLMAGALLPAIPEAQVGIFVGNAWDPQPGRETPWIDLARQVAGDAGVALLGNAAMTTPPGTETLHRLFAAAGKPVLLLFDEVLNFVNRHRGYAEPFYAYIQNLTIAMTGTSNAALVISLPRSQMEMTDFDIQWQDRISKVVRRVASNLVANDEGEIADVVRRRLFEDMGSEQTRRNVARSYADWCFENRAQLPPEWTAVETARTDTEAREFLRRRFESAYPFHPATLSVFQRKWASVPHFQATRGTLAMLAQWVSLALRDGYTYRRDEPLITLGSAPLHSHEFRGVALGQLGESRLLVAIDADIAGEQAHARALDVDTRDALREIHRRVGSAIFFESSGGQVNRMAHLPEMRFAIGGPTVDTTTVDTAAFALENRSFYIRRVGADGFQISYKPTLKKVVSERRASLDYRDDVLPEMRKLVRESFERGRTLSLTTFPATENDVADSPRLTLVLLDPESEWSGETRSRLAAWTRKRGQVDRLYPGALVWCVKQPGSKLRQEVQDWLAWRQVEKEIGDGTLGGDLSNSEIAEVRQAVRDEGREAQDEVWSSYRYLALYDPEEADGLRMIDLGAGHAAAGETLSGRVVAALKANSLLNESVGAGYMDRSWPPALVDSGAWPLKSLRQCFLDGSLTRLIDPDATLKSKIVEFVRAGEFGLASGPRPDGSYEHLWHGESVSPDEVAFETGVFLLRKATAQALKQARVVTPPPAPAPQPEAGPEPGSQPGLGMDDGPAAPEPQPGGDDEVTGTPPPPSARTLRLNGSVPADTWNRIGTRLIPKLRSGGQVDIQLAVSVAVEGSQAEHLAAELRQILEDLGLGGQVRVE